MAVADDELRARCVDAVREHSRLRLLGSGNTLHRRAHPAEPDVVVVGATDRNVYGVWAIEVARELYSEALLIPVTQDDLPERILDLAAFAVSDVDQDADARSLDLAAIRAAVDAGQPELLYQPVFDLRGGRLIGVEALARFRVAPERPPNEWFAAAHRVGLGIELERSTLQRASVAARGLPSDAYMAVNVAPATVLATGFDALLAELPLTQLVLELTEHDPVDDYKALRHALERARELGVRIAIDDVGAGFASLRHVLRLDPDIIKLDHEITRGVESDPGRAKLVGSLIAGASAVSTLVVAEGIETEAQLARLLELGVSGGQGYFLGRPGRIDEAITDVGAALSAIPAVPATESSPPEARRALNGARILIVDDSSAHRALIRSVFEIEDAIVHEASTVATAIEALDTITPDLVLLDVRLPDGNGFEVLEHLRRTTDTPALFVTAATAVSDRIAGFDRGADDYLLKPFSPDELVARVDAALRRRSGGSPRS